MTGKIAKLLTALPAMGVLGMREAVAVVTRLYMRAFWQARGVNIDPAARVFYARHELLVLGAGSHVGPFSVVIAVPTPACPEMPLLRVGERTYIGDQVNLRAAGGTVTIGNDCLIANGVTIVSSNHGLSAEELIIRQPWTRGDIAIGDDVWIGAGAVILPGVRIGRGAVVAAGAVVRQAVEEYAIVAGVPARAIGSRRSG